MQCMKQNLDDVISKKRDKKGKKYLQISKE